MTLPNLLTLVRVLTIPPIVAAILLADEFDGFELRGLATVLFVLASVSDWLDGYLARKLDQGSALGRMMDPIADKVLVVSILVSLTATGELASWTIVATLIIIARELLVAGLREALAGRTVSLPVSYLAKIKTAVQLVALTFLLAAPLAPAIIGTVGLLTLWLAAILSLVTGVQYFMAGLRQLGTVGAGE